MKMDRFFTGLVALVAGLALSAGSAYATKGYLMGDAAPSKLVPHYEIGDTKNTIIGVQNLMSGDNMTAECTSVADPTQEANAATTAATPQACRLDFDKNDRTDPTPPSLVAVNILGGGTVSVADQLRMANANANMDDAKNLIVTAMAYGPSGKMQATTDICLGPGAFGYVVISKMDMDMDMGPNAGMLSMSDGIGVDGEMEAKNDDGTTTIGPKYVDYGYVTLVASDRVRHCDGRRTPSDEPVEITVPNSDAANPQIANPAIAAWTIVQDVGMGFFGVEVPTPTVTMNRGEGGTIVGDGMLACYDMDSDDAAADAAATTRINEADSAFDQMKCGLIPERHNNDRVATGEVVDASATSIAYMKGDPDTRGAQLAVGAAADDAANGYATPLAKAYVRYDVNMMAADTKVFVWLGTAEEGRELDITVHCEEGMSSGIDDPSANTGAVLSTASIAMSDKHLMLDPSKGELGDFTDECDGSRGVLEIKMPDGSHAGMVWSHIALDGATYRMNFPGYSMANDMSCRQAVDNDAAEENDSEKMRADMCM